ncbi:uncharacterized protein C2845_PM07G36280 [Panicum miliaceum]|uniref:Uncharacterized protein n=1 Tax=Panicum miliaceum TaxID=4540 RepID=A0A3L6SJ58_PANMI|nr:uncharacterized protein C2845_PM07G36280 [Panicum miliaceum]
MRRDLLNVIHRYYLDAISRLPPAELRTTLARGLLVGGHCFGPLGPVHNIIVNIIQLGPAAFPLRGGGADDTEDDEVRAILATDGIVRICHRSLQGLVASLRHYCPSLSSRADALYQLMNADADLSAAVALANGTTRSSALQAMASQNLVAFQLAADAAQHPNPTTFAHFAASLLPTVSAQHNIPMSLLINRFLSAGNINHLSTVLLPGLPNEPRQPSLALRPQVIDWITSQKQQFKDTGKQVLDVVNMASQHYALQTGEQLILHSVCGVSLLNEQGLEGYYHINFLANRKDSGSAVGAPVLLFTETIVLAHDEIDVHLCALVDPLTDIGCCFACEKNKKKIVHPTYDEYCGCRNFEEDEVDSSSNFPKPLDVDYIFFDADRDRAVVNYLDDQIGCDGIGYPDG